MHVIEDKSYIGGHKKMGGETKIIYWINNHAIGPLLWGQHVWCRNPWRPWSLNAVNETLLYLAVVARDLFFRGTYIPCSCKVQSNWKMLGSSARKILTVPSEKIFLHASDGCWPVLKHLGEDIRETLFPHLAFCSRGKWRDPLIIQVVLISWLF